MTTGNVYRFKGRVVSVGKTERLGKDPNRPFYKRTAVIDDADPGDKYPNPVPFEATGEYCGLFDKLVVGATVEVAFHLAGREWKDKQGQTRHFCSNKVVKVVSVNAGGTVDLPMSVPEPPDNLGNDVDGGDDMPF